MHLFNISTFNNKINKQSFQDTQHYRIAYQSLPSTKSRSPKHPSYQLTPRFLALKELGYKLEAAIDDDTLPLTSDEHIFKTPLPCRRIRSFGSKAIDDKTASSTYMPEGQQDKGDSLLARVYRGCRCARVNTHSGGAASTMDESTYMQSEAIQCGVFWALIRERAALRLNGVKYFSFVWWRYTLFCLG